MPKTSRRTVCGLVVDEEAERARLDPVLLDGSLFALVADSAEHVEVVVADVAQGPDRARLDNREQVERRHSLLVPFTAPHKPRQHMWELAGCAPRQTGDVLVGREDEALIGVVVPVEDLLVLGAAVEDVVHPKQETRRSGQRSESGDSR